MAKDQIVSFDDVELEADLDVVSLRRQMEEARPPEGGAVRRLIFAQTDTLSATAVSLRRELPFPARVTPDMSRMPLSS